MQSQAVLKLWTLLSVQHLCTLPHHGLSSVFYFRWIGSKLLFYITRLFLRSLNQVSTMDLGASGSISEGIEIVTSVIARYEIIERLYLYPTTASMDCNLQLLNHCIIKVYTIILKYLIKAKKFLCENTAKRIVKAPFTNMEAENTRLRTAIKNADDETDRITSLLQDQRRTDESKTTREALKLLLEETMSPVVRMARNISDINDKLDRSQRREVLHWLSTVPCH